jgi:hypothetical protein
MPVAMALRGMPGYSVEIRVLHEDEPSPVLHRTHAEGAVAPGSREHHADRLLPLLLGEGTEEEVDGEPVAAGLGGLQKPHPTLPEHHGLGGRDDVDAVRLDLHAVGDLEDLEVGLAPDQLHQEAFVVGGQVLNEHQGNAGVLPEGRPEKKASNAARPPAEAPIPTMGNSAPVLRPRCRAGPGCAAGQGARGLPRPGA